VTNRCPRSILIVNAHSQANAGDYAIVLGQLQLLEKIVPAARLTITSRTPRLDRPLLASRGVKVIAPVFNAPAGCSGKWLPLVKTLLSIVLPLQALVFLRHLHQSDLVMACGGGYFYSTRRFPGFTFWQNYLHIRLAVLFKKKIIFSPQSYGPLANPLSRRLFAWLIACECVRTVFAREGISLALLLDIFPAGADNNKLQSCPDMAFTISPGLEQFAPLADLSGLPCPRLALALRDWDFPGQKTRQARQLKRETYLQAVIATCQALYLKYGSSFFIFSQAQGPSFAEDDRRISRVVYNRLGAVIPCTHLRLVETPVGISPAGIIQLLRQADMLITSRMHAAILAFMTAVPSVVIGYQHKSLGILQTLGLESCFLAIEETAQETLWPRCDDVWQNRQELKKRIAASVRGNREMIETKFRMFFEEDD
jgi:colanic acid/amylovoran biosynthesis protein